MKRRFFGDRLKISFASALALSLALHALPFGVYFAAISFRTKPKPQVLALDTLGIIANRQTEAAQEKTAQPIAEAKPQSPPPKPKPKPKPKTEAVALPKPPDAEKAPPIESVQTGAKESEQIKQTIDHSQSDADAIGEYVKEMGRVINRSAVYPKSAQGSGFNGSVVLRIVVLEDGTIANGNVEVTKSSAIAAIDNAAIEAITSNLPLPRPPRKLTISLSVSFSEEPFVR
ncbi:MAG: energy transducer TonB [Helicobacteraceae bacterium]|jgi:protein TonB|nr:energy transducer TonB [Helicobacteraceae bacterium]